MFVGLQPCIRLLVATVLLLHPVDAMTTRLTATSTKQTRDFPVFMVAESAGLSNTIIIETIQSDDLVEIDVRTIPGISTEDCKNGGAIKLYSGGSPPSGYYMGSTCGGYKWTWFASSHNTVMVSLNYTAIKDLDTVSVQFNIQKTCGSPVTVGESPVYVRSPNYPNRVPAEHKSCVWAGDAGSGNRIQFTIKFSTPETFDCRRTNVTFFDGRSLYWNRRYIHTWCGEEPSKFISWEHQAAVYASGLNDMFLGFEVEMRAVSGPKCQYYIDGDTSKEGVIANPIFPSSFPDLQECRWIIQTSEKKVMNITVINSYMAGGKDCDVDSVEIYLNAQALTGVVDKWCNGFRFTYEYYTRALLLIFKSNGLNTRNYNGFQAKYTIGDTPSCSESLRSTPQYQEISTPNYPDKYPGNQKCVWTISADDAKMVVELKVLSIDLRYGCDDDKVIVYDGKMQGEASRLGTFCGGSRPEYRSKSSSMTVVFISTTTNTRKRGFKAQYRTGLCGDKYKVGSYEAVVYSPGYPQHYGSGYNCYWNISSSWGAMGFRFTDLDIRCPRDFIMVYDGKESHRNHKTWKICGTTPQSFYTTNSHVFINLQTTNSEGKGFNLTYRGYYKEYQGCGNYVFALYPNKTYNTYHSPGYPGNYFDRLQCRYSLSSFYQIQVTIHIRRISYASPFCNGDYIRVYDGLHNTDPILHNKLCVTGNTTVRSTGRHLYVEFYSDEERTGPGYMIYYRTVGDKIYDPDNPEVETSGLSGSDNTIVITLSVLIPTVAVFICSMAILCYAKCKGQGGESQSARDRRRRLRINGDHADLIRARLEQYGAPEPETPDSPHVPSAPAFTEPSSPAASPPSYAEISSLPPLSPPSPSAPPEPSGDNSQHEVPPPSYREVSSDPNGDNSQPEVPPPSYREVSSDPSGDNSQPEVPPPSYSEAQPQSMGDNSQTLVLPPSYNEAIEGNMALESQTFV